MLPFSLRLPDALHWRLDKDYSPTVARALVRAYADLRWGEPHLARFRSAADRVRPVVALPMSERQRIRVTFVLSLEPAAVGDYLTALFWLDQALEVALDLACRLPDDEDLLDLLHVRGAINRALLRMNEAVEDYRDCLACLRAREQTPPQPSRPGFEVEVVAQIAGLEFFLARYATAEQLLAEARSLLPQVAPAPERDLAEATLAWLEANLYRWRGQPELALRPAAAAAEVYTEASAPTSAARSQLLIADVALDFAEHLPEGMDRYGMLTIVQPHLQLALELAAEAHDAIGQGMAELTHVRYGRVVGHTEDRIARIERVAHTARRHDDDGLRAQAVTALGDELTALGETESALNRYREVLVMLEGSEVPAMGVWARRALHRAWEQRTD
jgi:tetratricopeptide (TPR) repeat protein